MPTPKPLVAVANICQFVIEEKDKVLSAIRLVDTYYVKAPDWAPPDVVPAIELTLLISLRSGDVIGQHEISIVLRGPTGPRGEVHKGPVVFKGGEHAVNMRVHFALATRDFGLYWFDVLFGGEVLTSIPLKLLPIEASQQPQSESPP